MFCSIYRRGKYTALLFTATLVLAVTAFGQQSQSTGTSGQGKGAKGEKDPNAHFVRQAARENDVEIALAEIGVRKAQNPSLKSFCQQVQQTHIQANDQLKPIAQKFGVPIDESLTRRNEKELGKFQKLSGQQFDQQLAKQMLKQHEKDLARFEQARPRVSAPEVKQYADSMLPKLRQHLDQAAKVAGEVGVDRGTISSIMQKAPSSVGGTAQAPESGTGTGAKNSKGAGGEKLQQGSPSATQ